MSGEMETSSIPGEASSLGARSVGPTAFTEWSGLCIHTPVDGSTRECRSQAGSAEAVGTIRAGARVHRALNNPRNSLIIDFDIDHTVHIHIHGPINPTCLAQKVRWIFSLQYTNANPLTQSARQSTWRTK